MTKIQLTVIRDAIDSRADVILDEYRALAPADRPKGSAVFERAVEMYGTANTITERLARMP